MDFFSLSLSLFCCSVSIHFVLLFGCSSKDTQRSGTRCTHEANTGKMCAFPIQSLVNVLSISWPNAHYTDTCALHRAAVMCVQFVVLFMWFDFVCDGILFHSLSCGQQKKSSRMLHEHEWTSMSTAIIIFLNSFSLVSSAFILLQQNYGIELQQQITMATMMMRKKSLLKHYIVYAAGIL